MNKRVLCFGEILWDLLPTGRVLGGAPLNFAFRLHSLGEEAMLASRVGADDLGSDALDKVGALGLPTNLIQHDHSLPTGTVPVRFVNGQPEYTITPDVAYDAITLTKDLHSAAQSADAIYFGTICLRDPRSAATLNAVLDLAPASAERFVDLNLRAGCYTPGTIRHAMERATHVKLSSDEAEIVASAAGVSGNPLDLAARLAEKYNLHACLVTLGPQGAAVAGRNGEQVRVPGRKVTVRDTVGAGDAFGAGFLHAYLQGDDLGVAARLGNILGSLAATKEGGTAKITLDEIKSARNDLN